AHTVLYGESLGGALAVQLAADLSDRQTPPGGLILRSAFTSMTGAARGIFSVVFAPDGKHVATGGFDGKVRIYNAETGSLDKELVPVEVTPAVAGK
ncbi:MAG: hypothetical protein ACK5EA_03940, partial [Planctomycetaceae bacterium]